MIPVDEVDVGIARRAEQHGITQGATGGRVSRGIFGTKVGFDLDDASCEFRGGPISDQDLTQELAGYAARVTGEEGAGEGLNFR
jgi:hypothetical protein